MSVWGPERLTVTTCSDCSTSGESLPRPTGCSHRYSERGVAEYVRVDLHAGIAEARGLLEAALTGHTTAPCTFSRGEMADLEMALNALRRIEGR